MESTGYYYSFVRNESSKDLLVVFSHLGRKPPKFAWYKVLQSLSVNLLFVNCDGAEWYRGGIKGLGNDIDSTLVTIKRIAESIHPQCGVFMAGGSMGGYGALLYGAKFGAKAVFASAAELILGLPGGKSTVLDRSRWSHVYPDLRVVANISVRRHVVYGAMHLLDTLSAGLYKGAPNTRFYSVDGADHSVSDTLAKRDVLTSALERMLAGESDVLDRQLYPEGLAVSDKAGKMWLLNALLEEKSYTDALPLAEILSKEFDSNPLPLFLAGVCSFNLKNWGGAKEYLERSYAYCQGYASIPLHLGVIESRLKNYSKALEYLYRAMELDNSPSIVHYQIGRVLEVAGDLEGALSFYKRAVEINPNHLGYKNSLEMNQKKLGLAESVSLSR